MAFMRDPFTNMTMNFDESRAAAATTTMANDTKAVNEPRNIVVTTKYVDGQQIVTKKFQDNQGETTLLYENGKLISTTFNC